MRAVCQRSQVVAECTLVPGASYLIRRGPAGQDRRDIRPGRSVKLELEAGYEVNRRGAIASKVAGTQGGDGE